ncbi:MAG TPA: serine hydrolase domain-containing protein [Spirochaetia bacterium]|nr:serine hydrolase domain-containing protein [Spirochaetia bacterium]
MVRATTVTLVLFTLASCTFWQRIDAPIANSATVDTQIRRAMRAAHIPGLSIAVVEGNGVAWEKSFGVRDVESRAPVTNATVFEAASLGKPVFAYAVLRLAAEGKIDLDRPLSRYWVYPDIADDGRSARITAAMVLSHTSGLQNWRDDSGLQFVADPGESFVYSGEGYLYLQRVVEKITGANAETVAREKVLAPFGMRDSFFTWNKRAERNYAVGTDGAGNPVPKYKPTSANVAGGFHTTAADYGKFLAAVMQGRGLNRTIWKRMTEPVVKLWIGKGKDPDFVGWGLGFALQYTHDEGLSLWHWGDNDIFKGYMVAYPARRIAVVYFANSVFGLSIRDQTVTAAIGGKHPAFQWVTYPQVRLPPAPAASK